MEEGEKVPDMVPAQARPFPLLEGGSTTPGGWLVSTAEYAGVMEINSPKEGMTIGSRKNVADAGRTGEGEWRYWG